MLSIASLFRRKKSPLPAFFKLHRCSNDGCGQNFRSAKECDAHMLHAQHCIECGWGYSHECPVSSPQFCLGCFTSYSKEFPTDRSKIV